MDEGVVARRLVVPGEALPAVADLGKAAGKIDPAGRRRLGLGRAQPPGAIGGPQRIGGEQRQNVRQQQFLMLLLVIDADLDEPGDLGAGLHALREKIRQPRIDMRAIRQNALDRRSRENAAPGARLARPLAFVIGIEAVVEGFIEHPVAGQVLGENEGLEEPRDVREVPFGRARILRRLDGHVLGRQRVRQSLGQVPRVEQTVFENALTFDGRAPDRALSRHRSASPQEFTRHIGIGRQAAPNHRDAGQCQCACLLLVPCGPIMARSALCNCLHECS